MDINRNYIQNQFCSYEIALKLKELGFDEKCVASYYTYDIKNFSKGKYDYRGKFEFDYSTEDQYIVNSNETYYVSAPLWQQVVDWLETKGYYINITRVFQWSPLPIEFLGWCIYIGIENPEEQLECNSYYVRHYYPTKQEAREQAILKAIELCKKNYHKN